MGAVIVPALRMLAVLTALTGAAYPAVVTGVARIAFPGRAGGSLVRAQGRVVGSSLIGQPFSSRRYFWSRLSATGPFPYNGAVSSGSNYGPLNPALKDAAEQRAQALRAAGAAPERIPVDLMTASGSGLDPHISPAAAELQRERVAAARGLPLERIAQLVRRHTEPRAFGVLGEPRVNVLLLNLALDSLVRSP